MIGEYRCNVCGRTIHEGDNWYMPRSPSDEQITVLEALYRVNAFDEFTVCEDCMGHSEFGTWLEWHVGDTISEGTCWRSHDWTKEGF